jgi:hypothetical protein
MKLDNYKHQIPIKKTGLPHWRSNITSGSWPAS